MLYAKARYTVICQTTKEITTTERPEMVGHFVLLQATPPGDEENI